MNRKTCLVTGSLLMLLALASTCTSVLPPSSNTVTPFVSGTRDVTAAALDSATQQARISDFITSPSISIPMADSKTEEEISTAVLNAWLDKFTRDNVESSQRLMDYKILKVKINGADLACAHAMGAEFMAEGFYSIKPTYGISGSDWVAGSGNLNDIPGWITNKVNNFAVFKAGSQYFMMLSGVGGC